MDCLRVLATLAVILLHITAQNFYTVTVESFEWKVFNSVDSSVRWGVPVFVMISGALFLDPSKTLKLKKIYTCNIFRMITVFIFWSAIYAADGFFGGRTDFKDTLAAFVKGHYHMWFIYMIVGLYVIVPLVRQITSSKELTEYFLIVGGIATFLIPRMIDFIKCMEIPHTITFLDTVNYVLSKMQFHFTLGYVCYFVLGLYLSKYGADFMKGKKRAVLIFLTGLIATILLTDWYSVKQEVPKTTFYNELSVNVLLMAVGIFVIIKNIFLKGSDNSKWNNILYGLSRYTFGAYLSHVLVLEKLNELLGLNTLTWNPILSIGVLMIIVTVASFGISIVLNHIPIIGKYIT